MIILLLIFVSIYLFARTIVKSLPTSLSKGRRKSPPFDKGGWRGIRKLFKGLKSY
jgi:hypothetical protein